MITQARQAPAARETAPHEHPAKATSKPATKPPKTTATKPAGKSAASLAPVPANGSQRDRHVNARVHEVVGLLEEDIVLGGFAVGRGLSGLGYHRPNYQ